MDKILSRGYWRVLIRPGVFEEKRVPNILDLRKILQSCSVTLRGWDYPHMDGQSTPEVAEDWVGQGIDWEGYVEYWRFYQSGQFLHLDGIKEDWMEQRIRLGRASEFPDAKLLAVVSAVFTFTEIFELTTRLSTSPAGDETMSIDIGIHGLSGRQLWIGSQNRMPFSQKYTASIPQFRFQREYSKGELSGSAWSLALEPATELFRRFNWDPSRDILEGMQEELRGFRRTGQS